MIDDERLIYEIRNLIETPGEPSLERLAPLAASYSQRCEDVNTRLRECNQLLRQGLRSEALERAMHEPTVIEQVSILDFPERAPFLEACLTADVEPPPKLLTDVANKLQEAAETERVLSALLRKHRLLALARSPLSKRILTLRQIAEADESNKLWQRDLNKFEQARHQQIQVEADQAYRGGDLNTLANLHRELDDKGWTQKPPTALVEWVRQATRQLNAARAGALLRELVPQLVAAYEHDDLPRGIELHEQWNACRQAIGGDSLPPELSQAVAPAIGWIDQHQAGRKLEQKYAEAAAEFEQALDQQVGLTRLGSLHARLAAFDRPIAEPLETRYQSLERDARRRRRRRVTLVGAVATLALVIVGGGAGVGMYYVRQSQVIADHVQTVTRMVEQQRIGEAHAYLAHLNDDDAKVAELPEIRALETRVLAIVEQQRTRREEVSRALNDVEQAANFDEPTLRSLADAQQRVKAAQALELSEGESKQLAFLVERIDQGRVDVQKQIDADYSKAIADVSAQAAKIAAAEQQGQDSQLASQKLLQSMRELKSRSGQASSDAVARLDTLIQQQDALQRKLADQSDRRRAVDRVSQAVPDVAAFCSALDVYAKQYQNTSRATQFTAAGKEAPLWRAVERWNRLAERWERVDLRKIKSSEAQALVTESRQALSDEVATTFPWSAGLHERVQYLESVVARQADNRAATRKLTTLLNDPTMSSLRVVQVQPTSGALRRYYVIDSPMPLAGGEQLGVKYIPDFDLSQPRRNAVVPRTQIVMSGTSVDQPAPQTAVARKGLDLLSRELDTRGWENVFLDLVESIQAAHDIDPLVRLLLLDVTLEAGSKGSSHLAKAVQPLRETIAAAEIDLKANWLSPDDQVVQLERQKASLVLERLTSAADVRTTVAQEMLALNEPWLDQYQWVGCLLKDDQPGGIWTCTTRGQANASGDLVVVRRSGDRGAAVVEKIGRLIQGSVTLDGANTSSYVEGRAVFAIVSRGVKQMDGVGIADERR